MTAHQAAHTVLVVEDDPTIRRLIELCLEQPARHIDLRPDGAGGLAAIQDGSPDVVVLDLALPDIDGWEVLRKMRLQLSEDVAVVIVTAEAQSDARVRAELEGADAFMTKPFKPKDLRELVDLLAPA